MVFIFFTAFHIIIIPKKVKMCAYPTSRDIRKRALIYFETKTLYFRWSTAVPVWIQPEVSAQPSSWTSGKITGQVIPDSTGLLCQKQTVKLNCTCNCLKTMIRHARGMLFNSPCICLKCQRWTIKFLRCILLHYPFLPSLLCQRKITKLHMSILKIRAFGYCQGHAIKLCLEADVWDCPSVHSFSVHCYFC